MSEPEASPDPNPDALKTLAAYKEEPLLAMFAYRHLPANLRTVSMCFYGLAHRVCTDIPRNSERTVALRNLLLAKDAAVRAVIFHTHLTEPK